MRGSLKRSRSLAALSVSALLLLAACGSDSGSGSDTTAAADAGGETTAAAGGDTTAAAGGDMSALVDAATEEGQVNLIALPDNWANYGGILQSFRDKYPGIENPVATPEASSAEELTAVKTLAGQADMPDSIDVGPPFALQAVEEGLWEPYKASTWDEVPEALKDPDGNWVGSYYGIMAIGTNTTLVDNPPATFADLEKPEYKGQVSLNGDPREAGAAFAAVMAASLANGGSFDDIMPGIQYFADLKASGNLIPVALTEATILSGETPINLDWTYNWPGLQPKLEEAGIEVNVVVPSDGVYGSYYAQGVVKDSPHPNAAKLWVEHILSDEGALGYLEGGAIPARYAALLAAGKVSEDISQNLPDAELIEAIEFPTAAQLEKANAALTENWGPMVADA
ncbi:MAG TPA: extracellular solute-binding protein [Acidimicrobiales bacterium]|nr:extracellular solute-binding protein [Acidimicrobiales bacterium]